MPDVGVVSLGPSFLNPATSEWIDNTDRSRWITIENRLSIPIDVCPSTSDGSRDLVYGFTVPALTRSTVPILPDRGVRLSCLEPLPTNGNTAPASVGLPFGIGLKSNSSGNIAGRYYGKRNVPYMLHDNGGAPAEPIYPVESLIASMNGGITVTGATTPTYWVAYNQTGNPSTNLDAVGPVDMCIVAQTIQLLANNIATPQTDVVLQYIYDRDAVFPTPQLEGGFVLALPGTPVMTEMTVDARGAVGYMISIGGAPATDTVTLNVIDWIGSPGA